MTAAPKILELTKPLLYETGDEEWSYAYAGSCFSGRWGQNLYIVCAFHCYDKFRVAPEATLYPIPATQTEFFGFSCTLRAKLTDAQDLKHYEQIVLQVSNKLHAFEQTASLKAIDLYDSDTIARLTDIAVSDVWIEGVSSRQYKLRCGLRIL